jgi:hypothetical protein
MTVTTSQTRGPSLPPFPDVRRIAVGRRAGRSAVRGAGAEDGILRCRADPAGYRPARRAVREPALADRPGEPAAPGALREPPGRPSDEAEQKAFFARVRPVDLAVQVHGGGRWSHPFLRRLEPRWTVGARTPDAEEIDRWVPFRYYQNETMRALEVFGFRYRRAR